MTLLSRLHADIDHRVQTIRDGHPGWLCGKGCDGCCRRLADIPQLTAAEWELLREGLANLPPERLLDIAGEVAELTGRHARPVVCPLLDRTTGACPVYAQRPVACRSYGFYVQRDRGLYCREIEVRVAEGTLADVVWGNHDAVDRCLAVLGESRPLTEWFTDLELLS
jgi:Fe-S-cluster containining protein